MMNELTEAVEVCPWCCGENVFPNYDVSRNGYIVVCKHCGQEMMLCDECLHSDDNPHGNCDWHEDRHLPKSERRFGYCFRGTTKHWKNILKEILDMNTEKTYENVMKVLNRESIERKVLPRMRSSKELINVKERNNVYFEFLDMVETFYVPLDANDEERLVITEAIIDKVGMTSKELLQAAKRNIDKCWQIKSLSELMSELTGMPAPASEMDVPLFVATTNNRDHGASVFLSDSLMKAASGKFGCEVIILPSSVHEILLMPKSDDFKYEGLLEIVRTINRTEVSEEDFLSDNVYVYKDGNFQIIA